MALTPSYAPFKCAPQTCTINTVDALAHAPQARAINAVTCAPQMCAINTINTLMYTPQMHTVNTLNALIIRVAMVQFSPVQHNFMLNLKPD